MRYYELLTDRSLSEIKTLRERAQSGEEHPRDLKVDLAKRIITDFHSADAAKAAEEEFNRIFRRKEAPDEIEERTVRFDTWELRDFLVELELASSKSASAGLLNKAEYTLMATGKRTLIDAFGNQGVPSSLLLQVGKRRFVRVNFS